MSWAQPLIMAFVTRTTNPLHFEDLEPHRFEDLVRQLAYDFRPWRKLEATGRSGGDASFDIRGYEIRAPEDDEPENAVDAEPEMEDRQWLIQCKREKSIGPAKLTKYLQDISPEARISLHGVVIAAACDFSKATRDTLTAWARENGLSEAHMWGKAELEDQLFQPKNDNLLFAYFGISLQVRKRSVCSSLRSRLATKKRVEAVFGKTHHSVVLLRDPSNDRYPWAGANEKNGRGRWKVVPFGRLHPLGILVQSKRYFAWLSDDRSQWDILDQIDISVPSTHEDPWAEEQTNELRDLHRRAWSFWNDLPDKNRANYYEERLIRFEDILAIDEAGDDCAKCPHVYIDFDLRTDTYVRLDPLSQWSGGLNGAPNGENRATFFPKDLPKPTPIVPTPA